VDYLKSHICEKIGCSLSEIRVKYDMTLDSYGVLFESVIQICW
jgi:hypothetical protein